MTPEQFCYWLQGSNEISASDVPTHKEWRIIKDHLSLVFRKVTPAYPGSLSPENWNDHFYNKWADRPLPITC